MLINNGALIKVAPQLVSEQSSADSSSSMSGSTSGSSSSSASSSGSSSSMSSSDNSLSSSSATLDLIKKTAFTSRFTYSNMKKFKGMTWKKNNPQVVYPPFFVEYSTDGTTFTCWKNCEKQQNPTGQFAFDPLIEAKQIKIHMFPEKREKPDILVSFQFAQ